MRTSFTKTEGWKLGILRDSFGCTSGISVSQSNVMMVADDGHSRRNRKRDRRINSGHEKTTGMRDSAVKTERAVPLGDARNRQNS